MSQLMIKNLHVEVEGKEILKGIDLTAVSYTHLDVYKRQGSNSVISISVIK